LLIKQVEDVLDNIDNEYMLMLINSMQMIENNIKLFHDQIQIKLDQDNEEKYKEDLQEDI
jgi:hypothetical protein